MPNREKVIKGLENCTTGFECPPECPYLDYCNDLTKPMFVELAKDALNLLKYQQEQIKLLHIANDVVADYLTQPQIVRCKDCKYHATDMVCGHPSEWGNNETRNHCDPEWFCADGVAKDSNVFNK